MRNLAHGLRGTSLRRHVDNVANVGQHLLPVGGLPDVTAIDFDPGVSDQPVGRNPGNRPVGLRTQVVEQQHLPALPDEQFGDVPSNKSETPRDQYFTRTHR